MSVKFGTDGVRGLAGRDVGPQLALRLGRAVVTVLVEEGVARPSIIIGRDPRWSGDMLEAAVVAGITSAGGDAVTVGVVPTPAVAHLTATGDAAAGIMISASHNPMPDNGLKVFGGDGYKLTDDEEARLAELLNAGVDRYPHGTGIGRHRSDATGGSRYVEAVVAEADVELGGMTVAVDGAHGAAADLGPMVYRRLGADVRLVSGGPDARLINDGVGSTHPEVLQQSIAETGAALGLTHDGDADRLLAACADGSLVDGDQVLAILARDAHAEGALTGDTVATTVMTNLGFHHAMEGLGIDVVTTAVGDRYVLEAMRKHGLVLGGEQSGHLIQLDRCTTGDGIRTAVRLMRTIVTSGTSLEELATVMTRLPQVLINVSDVDGARLDDSDVVAGAIADVEAELGDAGRVLVRPSGTEPVVRVMVEAPTEQDAKRAADQVAAAIEHDLTV